MSLPIDHWNNVNKEQAAKSREYKRLLKSLQAIRPGSVLQLEGPSDQQWLSQLLERGQRFSRTKVEHFLGSRNLCHQNASAIWIMEQGLIGTGFAYSASSPPWPGAWYSHSWGLDCSKKTRRIIETTPYTFKDYYGVELDSEECQHFVLQNVLPMVSTVLNKLSGKGRKKSR